MTRSIGDACLHPSVMWSNVDRKERLDEIPQRIWKHRGAHRLPHYRTARGSLFLSHAQAWFC